MTTKTDILKSIRVKCLDCCIQQINEVRLCTVTKCALWPFRFGSDPAPARGGENLKARTVQGGSELSAAGATMPPVSVSDPQGAATEGVSGDGW